MKFTATLFHSPGIGFQTDVQVRKNAQPVTTEPCTLITRNGLILRADLPTDERMRHRVVDDIDSQMSWNWEDRIAEVKQGEPA